MPATEVLLQHDVGAVRVITLNRPERRNALNPEMITRLDGALADATNDDGVRVIVLTGTSPAFCAGLDLEAYFVPEADRTVPARVLRSIAMVPKPSIAAVNGTAATGGLELALNCDFIIASSTATFMDTHLRVGVLPGGGLSARFAQAVGTRRAKQLSFIAEPFDAEAARQFGMVNEVVAPDDLLPRAVMIADAIAKWDPELVQTVKHNYDIGLASITAAALEIELATNTRRRWSGSASRANDHGASSS